MILKFKVYEQTISLQATKSEPRQGSKDYLELQFSFSSDWNDLLKYVYLQHGEVSVPHDLVEGSIIVDEYFTEQTEFNVTLFGKSADGSVEVPTNVITVFLKESNNLWVKDAPAPQNSWVVQVIDARDEALAAAIRAENAAIRQPYPNSETSTWWVWDADSGAYKDTGVSVDSSITVDSELSDTSENPVQNKVIKSALDKLVLQSDWNQNDDIQPDYVKNRPFYTGGTVETTFVEDSTVSFTRNEYSGFYLGLLESTFVATVGETYKVSWDGTAYECTCADSNGKTIIGNLSMMGAGSDTGEPFIMMIHNRVGIEIATADTSASHTFSISGMVESVVKIDRKYLPKAAFITYDSGNSTYNSGLTNDELYEIMLNGEQVVLYDQSEKTHYYLKKWRIHLSGRIDLSFVREEFEITLFTDGTIGKTPNE